MTFTAIISKRIPTLLRPISTDFVMATRVLHRTKVTIPMTEPGREETVVLSKDKEVLVCWHPEPIIPYECTRPLPEVADTDTLLNVQYNEEVKELFKRQHPFFVSKKLQDLTFTTKYQWRPHPRKARTTNKIQPRDREYL